MDRLSRGGSAQTDLDGQTMELVRAKANFLLACAIILFFM
jgi:hypothetical protein